jgi:hypothetical protein
LGATNSLAARNIWAYKLTMSIDGPKKTRGRPPVDSDGVKVRFERATLDRVDALAKGQGITRPEAVRRLVKVAMDWLDRNPM